MKALIDGDVLVYQAGFASDTRMYNVGNAEFKYKKEANEYAKSVGFDPKNITKTITPEPLEYCLHSVKKMIESIKNATDADDVQVYVSSKKNFRNDLVTDYKANRDPTHKPHWHKEIRDYLIDVHNAKVVEGVEADDAIGVDHSQDFYSCGQDQLDSESMLCTIDKDLNMIGGWHYNWRREEIYWVTEDEGNRFFFKQWLTGDSADNIEGLKGVGEKTAEKILAPHTTVLQMYDCVMREWSRRTNRTFSQVHTIGDLLWIQRNTNDTWDSCLNLTPERKKLAT